MPLHPFNPVTDNQNPDPAAPPETAARRRKSPQLIDWRRAAQLLAGGEVPGAVAAALGIPERRLWRHLEQSVTFKLLISRAAGRRRDLDRLIRYGEEQFSLVPEQPPGETNRREAGGSGAKNLKPPEAPGSRPTPPEAGRRQNPAVLNPR